MTAAQAAPPHVLTAISAVMGALAKDGIAKDRQTVGNGPKYNFRGIDDVYNALSSVLAENKLVVTPRCLNRECVERKSNSGGALFYVTVDVEFTLSSAVDGSSITARTYGEALDSGDKATNKAMSAAFKYMAMQTFCIPTQGDNDADATTHEVASKAWEPSGPARVAVNTLETFQRDADGFREFWNLNKVGLKDALDGEDYAWVVGEMKRIAASIPAKPSPAVNGSAATKAAEALGQDEIPF